MGNIQDVPDYHRKPIFTRSRSPWTPRRMTGKNNAPYHRVLMKKNGER